MTLYRVSCTERHNVDRAVLGEVPGSLIGGVEVHIEQGFRSYVI